ncbi:UBP-type zinc finger domain-containing protein [Streptomyces sp. NPDC101171]|uniref:UBP-type zinc finger domain-containing protein n=1 Tax=Streptomyces sp. NPDC101171 TaxID=3366122 RepID=UPI003806C5DA
MCPPIPRAGLRTSARRRSIPVPPPTRSHTAQALDAARRRWAPRAGPWAHPVPRPRAKQVRRTRQRSAANGELMTGWVVRPDGGRPEGRTCAHVPDAGSSPVPRSGVCLECEARGQGGGHLRFCLSCGHTGCSDSSPGAHATAHHESTGHPLVRSMEPGEEWAWCYVDEVYLQPAGSRP